MRAPGTDRSLPDRSGFRSGQRRAKWGITGKIVLAALEALGANHTGIRPDRMMLR